MHRILTLLLACLLAQAPTSAQADDFDGGQGFTMEFGLGAGSVWTEASSGSPDHDALAFSQVALGVGAFVTPRLSVDVLAESVMSSSQRGLWGNDQTLTWAGLRVQHWLRDDWTVGFGLGLVDVNDEERVGAEGDGFAARLEASWVFSRNEFHTHHLKLSWMEGAVLDGENAARALVFGWVWQRL